MQRKPILLVKLLSNTCKEFCFHCSPQLQIFFQTFSWLLRGNDIWETIQKQSSIGVLIKRCSENMQQIQRKTNVRNCDFNKNCNFIEITLPHGCSPVNLLHLFRAAFRKNTYGGLLLAIQSSFTNSYSARNTRTRSETGFKYGTVFTKFELISQLVLVFFVNK